MKKITLLLAIALKISAADVIQFTPDKDAGITNYAGFYTSGKDGVWHRFGNAAANTNMMVVPAEVPSRVIIKIQAEGETNRIHAERFFFERKP